MLKMMLKIKAPQDEALAGSKDLTDDLSALGFQTRTDLVLEQPRQSKGKALASPFSQASLL